MKSTKIHPNHLLARACCIAWPGAVGVILIGMVGCSQVSTPMDASPHTPPIPQTGSILPLEQGNQWVYQNTLYDSAGNPMDELVRVSQTLSIPRVYGFNDSSIPIPITYENSYTQFEHYCYAYEWDSQGSGYLISNREVQGIRGIYLVGTYRPSSLTMHPQPHLWLKFPASAGDTYSICMDSIPTAENTTHIEVLSTKESFYFADSLSASPSPVTFVSCYVYKETFRDTVSYVYYNKTYGALGYKQFIKGILRRTYMLRAFIHNYSYF